MSGSPKRSQAEIERQRQQELEEKRRQQAALEAEQRKQREEEERQRLMAEYHQQLSDSSRALAATLARHGQASYAPFARGGFAQMEQRRVTLTREAQLSTALGRLRELESEFEALTRDINAAVALARASEQAEQLRKIRAQKQAEAEAAVGGLAARLEGHSEALARKFDPSGLTELQRLLESARASLAAGQHDRARALAEKGITSFEPHVAAVNSAHRTWEAARQAATTALESLHLRLEATFGDEVVQAWSGAELTALRLQVLASRSRLSAEDWQGARAGVESADRALEAAIERAQVRQLEEEKRAYIVSGLLSVLQHQGFQVGTPDLALPGDLESDVVIRAMRPDRRSLSIQVPVGGRVSYEVDGWARRQEATPDGGIASTCDEAEARLAAIHLQIKEEFGVAMGELEWEGKHPLRLRKGAKDLPSDGGMRRERGGRS